MKYSLAILILIFSTISCTKLEVEEDYLPSVNTLTPKSINTSLPVVNIEADVQDFEHMMAVYYNKVFVSGKLTTLKKPENSQIVSANMEMEIRGRSSVGSDFPLKSLGINFDETVNGSSNYGIDPEEILPNHHLDVFNTVRLRSSGNDFGNTMIKDLAYSRFAVKNGLRVEVMYGAPVQVFVNKEYYGLMNARSESSISGLATLLKLNPQQMTMLKVKDQSENLKYDEGKRSGAEGLLNAIKNKDSKGIKEHIDIENFIDYIIFQDYVGNADWANNIKAYNPGNGKFRFIVYDLDLAGNAQGIALEPKLEFLSADIGKIYRALMGLEGIQNQLEKRKIELYERFSVNDFNAIVDKMALEINDDMPYLIAKYGSPKSMLHWKMNIEQLKIDFEGRDRAIRKKYKLQ